MNLAPHADRPEMHCQHLGVLQHFCPPLTPARRLSDAIFLQEAKDVHYALFFSDLLGGGGKNTEVDVLCASREKATKHRVIEMLQVTSPLRTLKSPVSSLRLPYLP